MTRGPIDADPSLEALRRRTGPLVVAGNLSLDDTVNPVTERLDAPGGDALYASIGARLWGLPVRILVLAGEDYPEAYLQRMRDLGVATDLVRRVEGPTVHYRVVDNEAGNRTYTFLTSEARLAETSPTADDFARAGGSAWLHLAAMPIDHHCLGIEAARRAGIPVSLDPHEEYILGHEPTIRALVRGTVFMPSELETSLLFPDLAPLAPDPGAGHRPASDEPLDDAARAALAAERLDAWAPWLTVVKVGALGSIVRWHGRSFRMPVVPVELVDQIGAGDAYCGGFVAGLLRTGSLLAAAACGTVSASRIISHVGAFSDAPPPSRADLVELAAGLLAGRFDRAGDEALDRIRHADWEGHT